jgi:hypothetical protein
VRRYEVTKLLTLLTLRAHQRAAQDPVHVGVDPGFVRTNLGSQPPVASPALGELEDVARVFRQILTRSSPSGSPRSCAKRVLLNQAG